MRKGHHHASLLLEWLDLEKQLLCRYNLDKQKKAKKEWLKMEVESEFTNCISLQASKIQGTYMEESPFLHFSADKRKILLKQR